MFYDLCDKMGIAVIQDSEYNWTHPSTDEWAEKFIGIYKENVRMLMRHPSIICWIGMNEPAVWTRMGTPGEDSWRKIRGRGFTGNCRRWTDRPIIKGSFCDEDIFSGDSHNYLGSLSGGEYREIYGTTEKLNTEYGFDAPACAESLKKSLGCIQTSRRYRKGDPCHPGLSV